MGAAEADQATVDLAFNLGNEIAKLDLAVLCGGGSGVMQAVAKGAKKANGLTIAILKGTSLKDTYINPYIDIPIFTGMNDARNYINVCSSNVVVAMTGRFGTLSEIALAKKIKKPVICFSAWQELKNFSATDPLIYVENLNDCLTAIKRFVF